MSATVSSVATAAKTHGVVAEFDTPTQLLTAASRLADQGYKRYDAYSPFPIHGMDDAMKLPQSKLGPIVFIAGVMGFCAGLGLQVWVHVFEYPLIIGGKPFLSLPAFVPAVFELTVLFSAFGALLGMFGLNKLPMLHHPLFNSKHFPKCSNDKFFIAVEAADPKFDAARTKDLLGQLGGTNVEVVPE